MRENGPPSKLPASRKARATVTTLGEFDQKTGFDALHDQKNPLGLVKTVHNPLNGSGLFLMQDTGGSQNLVPNVSPGAASAHHLADALCTDIHWPTGTRHKDDAWCRNGRYVSNGGRVFGVEPVFRRMIPSLRDIDFLNGRPRASLRLSQRVIKMKHSDTRALGAVDPGGIYDDGDFTSRGRGSTLEPKALRASAISQAWPSGC